VRHRPGLHQVVEPHLGAVEPVLEVHVGGARGERVGHGSDGQIVRGDEADGAAIQQAAQHAGCACEPIVRVGPVEELVEQEQQRD